MSLCDDASLFPTILERNRCSLGASITIIDRGNGGRGVTRLGTSQRNTKSSSKREKGGKIYIYIIYISMCIEEEDKNRQEQENVLEEERKRERRRMEREKKREEKRRTVLVFVTF